MLQVGFPGVDKPAGGVVGHPFAARGGMECYDRCGRSGSIRRGDLARDGGHDLHDPRPTAIVGGSCAAAVQAADVPVAQPVKDQFDELPGGGDLTDVIPAALSDLVADSAQATVLVGTLDGFDRGPAHQPATLLSDPPTVHRGIRLMVFRSQPSPAGQLRRPAGACQIFRVSNGWLMSSFYHRGSRPGKRMANVFRAIVQPFVPVPDSPPLLLEIFRSPR